MVTEFKRFGLDKQRAMTGVFQLVGGLGLGIGYFESLTLAAISAAGLALLMLLGFIVRLKIKDSVIASAPALMYALLNGYLAFLFFKLI